MTIQCRTGCGQQIYYEGFPFPDGFIYYLPRNLDETIHDCAHLPHDMVDDDWPNDKEPDSDVGVEIYVKEKRQFPNNYSFEYENHMILNTATYDLAYPTLTAEQKDKPPLSLRRNSLLNTQISCVLFPSPFMYHYIKNEEYPLGVNWTDLLELSFLYESVEDYTSAITALLIQNKITNDQKDHSYINSFTIYFYLIQLPNQFKALLWFVYC